MIELKDFSREFTNDALDIRGRGVVDCAGALIGRVNSGYVDAFQRKCVSSAWGSGFGGS